MSFARYNLSLALLLPLMTSGPSLPMITSGPPVPWQGRPSIEPLTLQVSVTTTPLCIVLSCSRFSI